MQTEVFEIPYIWNLYFCVRFISYPRTETNMFPKSLDLRPLVQNQTVDENWGGMIEINALLFYV